jgi:hypothetical protein
MSDMVRVEEQKLEKAKTLTKPSNLPTNPGTTKSCKNSSRF